MEMRFTTERITYHSHLLWFITAYLMITMVTARAETSRSINETCPRDPRMTNQQCSKICQTDLDCKNKRSQCVCDGPCGMACVKVKPGKKHTVYCNYPGTIAHGQILLVGMIGKYEYRPYVKLVGDYSVIEYQCDEEYERVGPDSATCIRGMWSPVNLPECIQDSSTDSSYGTVEPIRIQVDVNIDESEDQMHAQIQTTVYCDHPGTIAHGKILLVGVFGKYEYSPYVKGNGIDQVIEYVCNEEYQRIGPGSATCIRGMWSPVNLPECIQDSSTDSSDGNMEPISVRLDVIIDESEDQMLAQIHTTVYCNYPGTIAHGKILLVGVMGTYEYRPYVRNVRDDQIIEYVCDEEHQRVGPGSAICLQGRWSPIQKPNCVEQKPLNSFDVNETKE